MNRKPYLTYRIGTMLGDLDCSLNGRAGLSASAELQLIGS